MLEVYALLDRMMAKDTNITLSFNQCRKICEQYHISAVELLRAIRQYCLDKDVVLEEYEQEEVLIAEF